MSAYVAYEQWAYGEADDLDNWSETFSYDGGDDFPDWKAGCEDSSHIVDPLDWSQDEHADLPDVEWEYWGRAQTDRLFGQQGRGKSMVCSDNDEKDTCVSTPFKHYRPGANLTALPCWLWPSSVVPKAVVVVADMPVWKSSRSWSTVGKCKQGDVLLPSAMPRHVGGHMMVDLLGCEGAVEGTFLKPTNCTSQLFHPALVVEHIGSGKKIAKLSSHQGGNSGNAKLTICHNGGSLSGSAKMKLNRNQINLLLSLMLIHTALGSVAPVKPGHDMCGRETS